MKASMHKVLTSFGLSLFVLAGAAQAQSCTCQGQGATQVTNTGGNNVLTNLLSGNTMCVGSANNWQYQEQHRTGGQLWDYKRGPGHAVDPTEQVGTWSITGNGASTTLRHTYLGGTATDFKVCTITAGTSYGLCQGASSTSSTTFTVKSGTSSGC